MQYKMCLWFWMNWLYSFVQLKSIHIEYNIMNYCSCTHLINLQSHIVTFVILLFFQLIQCLQLAIGMSIMGSLTVNYCIWDYHYFMTVCWVPFFLNSKTCINLINIILNSIQLIHPVVILFSQVWHLHCYCLAYHCWWFDCG